MTQTYAVENCRVEVLTDGEAFLGLGKAWIGETLVRSGRLPICVRTQTFAGLKLTGQRLLGVEQTAAELRVRVGLTFTPMDVKMLRDHSFDPIHDLQDWDVEHPVQDGELTIVIRPATDCFNGVEFAGFAYHYEYSSANTAIFYLLELASWELDGDIVGVTAISQSSCSAPVATFAEETAWTTEGVMHWADPAKEPNMIMTHNLPRWASHQAFDFQYKGDATLLGVFDHVELIRTTLRREAGKAELKCFDKHLFDQTTRYQTAAKKILLNTAPKSVVDQRNLWTWVIDEVHARARAEFGLQEEPMLPQVAVAFNRSFQGDYTYDAFRVDLLPAGAGLGLKRIYISNVNKAADTEMCPHPLNWFNHCCNHEYEPAPVLGGMKTLKRFIADSEALGCTPVGWSNNDQAISSPLNHWYKEEYTSWYVKMEDTRTKYGGAYMHNFHIWSFNHEPARRYWIDCLKKTRAEAGLQCMLFDSFYNLGFMPIDFRNGTPRTHWRKLLESFKELQDADVHFLIESFGPFGAVMHGCPPSYNLENIYAVYKVSLGTGYTTIPGDQTLVDTTARHAQELYYTLAHMTNPQIPLHLDGKRIDQVWGAAHRRALADYHANRPYMHRRYLQEDGQAVLWHDAAGIRATLWNFTDRTLALPGTVTDVTTGEALPPAEAYALQAGHTYAIAGAALPVAVGEGRQTVCSG